MKLRSIVTAGLLGAGLLMMSGCDWLDDEIEDALPKIASINVVNASEAPSIGVTVDGVTQTVDYQSTFKSFVTTTTNNTVNVSYTGGDSIDVSSSGVHIVGINTNCSTGHFVKDTLDNNKIRLMNLTTTSFDPSDAANISITLDGIPVTFPSTIGGCDSVSAHDGSLVGTWEIKINGSVIGSYTVDANTLISGYELIVYDIAAKSGTVIPLL